jgi:hypothetical protein
MLPASCSCTRSRARSDTTRFLSGNRFLREEFRNKAEFVDAVYQDDDVVTENLGQHFVPALVQMRRSRSPASS